MSRIPHSRCNRRARSATILLLVLLSTLDGGGPRWLLAQEGDDGLCSRECRPLSSLVALILDGDGGAGVDTIPELVKLRVEQFAAANLPDGVKFPLKNTTTDSLRALQGIRSDVVASWLDPLTAEDSADAPHYGPNNDYLAYFGDGWNSDWVDDVVGAFALPPLRPGPDRGQPRVRIRGGLRVARAPRC